MGEGGGEGEMKPLHVFECESCGKQREARVKWNTDVVKCKECGGRAERVWVRERSVHQQFATPIVLWRYTDGTLGVAGRADAKTPKNADRVEIHNLAEYRQHVKELNGQTAGRELAREERYQREVERLMKDADRELSRLLASETDPAARDLLREAMRHGYERPQAPREWYAEVMEG